VLRAPHACTSLRAACPGAASSRFGLPVCARAHLRPARVRPALASPSARAASLVWPCPGAHVPACGLPTCGLPLFRLPAFACPHLRRAHVRPPLRFALATCARPHVRPAHVRASPVSPSPRAHVRTCALPTCGLRGRRTPHVRTAGPVDCTRVHGGGTVGRFVRPCERSSSGPVGCERAHPRANLRPPQPRPPNGRSPLLASRLLRSGQVCTRAQLRRTSVRAPLLPRRLGRSGQVRPPAQLRRVQVGTGDVRHAQDRPWRLVQSTGPRSLHAQGGGRHWRLVQSTPAQDRAGCGVRTSAVRTCGLRSPAACPFRANSNTKSTRSFEPGPSARHPAT
jgi:hypothetical protein